LARDGGGGLGRLSRSAARRTRRGGLLARNYGEAAALDVYGPAIGGPKAISGHNSYFLWEPRGATGAVVIALAADRGCFRNLYDDVRALGRIDNA
jgi:hypothetical protein